MTTAETVHTLGSIFGADWVGILPFCLVDTILLETINNPNKREARNAKKNRK